MALYNSGERIKIEGDDISMLFSRLPDDVKKTILRDSAQLFENSTKAGYLRQIDPEGKQWKKNPKWVQDIKGQDTPLTGPLTTRIKGGRLSGKYKLKKVNTERMKNSLISKVDANQAVIEYKRSAYNRAKINQYGGKSAMVFESLTGGKDKRLSVIVQRRVHLGIAKDFYRIPGGTDPDLINEIAGQHLTRYLEAGGKLL